MRIVTAQELESWLTNGKVLEEDGRGLKVIHLSDDRILKIFRPRRRFWLSRLTPQALRFKRNAEQLLARGITAPHVTECFWLDQTRAISCCLYTPIPGRSLEQIYQHSLSEFNLLLVKFAEFIYLLHQRGIYFRSLHLGNVLLLPNGTFGLIDFLDIKFKRTSLSPWLVKRNLEHLRSYLQRNQVEDFPWADLKTAYNKTKQG